MANPGDDFVFKLLQQQDIPACVRIAADNFAQYQIHPDYVEQWFERRIVHNPWQVALPGIGVGVWHGTRLIGLRAMFVQPWWLDGRTLPIAFGANINVDARYQGQGLATRLVESSRHLLPLTGSVSAGVTTQKIFTKLGFVAIGVSGNDFFRARIDYRGSWIKRAGWKVGSLLGKVCDAGLWLRDRPLHGDGFLFEEVEHCGEEFDHLWDLAKPGYLSCLEHSSRYLNWRLFEFPTCPLCLSAVRDLAGTLRAYAIWHRQEFAGAIATAVLRDVFYAVDDETALRALLYHLFEYWRQVGITWASLELASPRLTALFRQLGYESVPSRGNRYWISSDPPLDEAVLRNWYRSGIDGDYFDHPL